MDKNKKIILDDISKRFILAAIQFQEQGGVIFEDFTPDRDFKDFYGFTRQELKKCLDNLRQQITNPLPASNWQHKQ